MDTATTQHSTVSSSAPEAKRPGEPRLATALRLAERWLLSIQHADGHWCGELEGDTILETEYVLLLHFLGRLRDPRVAKAARYVRGQQQAHGGWAIYPGGPPEVSASVKAYFALKMAGDDPQAPHMASARRTILRLGGVEACNSFTKLYLAICGQYDWRRCPAVPPEMVLLPRWFYFNLYAMSSWSRAIVVPLSVVWALRPVRPVAPEHAIGELFVRPGDPAGVTAEGAESAGPAASGRAPGVLGGASHFWRAVFTLLDRGLKVGERLHLTPLRRRSLARAEEWILTRLEDSDGLGAIFPPIVNTVFALCCLGYGTDHPQVRAQLGELERLEIEEDGALRLQPCFSPVWDTALALHALGSAGFTADHPAVRAGRRWLVENEIRRADGDWAMQAPGTEAGGWCFEYRNAFYPDCDDTAEVLTAFASTSPPAGPQGIVGSGARAGLTLGAAGSLGIHPAIAAEPAVARGVAWLLAMQNDDGGWGAFDRGCDREILTHVPFADHNALLDPSTSDVTGRAVDCLGRLGLPRDAQPVQRALAFLHREQEEDGSWYGRWGCNFIYGTWLALQAFARFGSIGGEPWCRRAVDWLLAHQNEDGGWGETSLSYDDPSQKGIGPSTAAQTAWALLGLFAAGVVDHPAAARGIDHLLATQRDDGSWYDETWTATGFPRVFYLRYHLYAVYFPLTALAEYRRLRDEARSQATTHSTYSLAVPLSAAAAIEGVVR